ncbi:hypothetical protein ACFX13_021382 [Malus domestica]
MENKDCIALYVVLCEAVSVLQVKLTVKKQRELTPQSPVEQHTQNAVVLLPLRLLLLQFMVVLLLFSSPIFLCSVLPGGFRVSQHCCISWKCLDRTASIFH